MAAGSKSQEFTASGTFNVPAGVSLVRITAIGGGSSGQWNNGSSTGGCAGGSAAYCIARPTIVTPGGTLSIVVGAKGTGTTTFGSNAGTASTAGIVNVDGASAFGAVVTPSGPGGGGGGGASVAADNGPGLIGTRGSIKHGGGASGGAAAQSQTGGNGGPAPGVLPSSVGHYGGGGASSIWGKGGDGGNGTQSGGDATTTNYGAGGGGTGHSSGGSQKGGNGAPGYVRVEWIDAA
jgi:hypothetical protein